ncbi:hypothetical protein DPMN_148605 [Dreissena polymorpha]|uniref:Uncharacterized protein n=1 Tax=Dreissena polymorpha TaxID=45954 RepID=A0A9D4FC70_DREPO|nr:hypothetical protein DPMN_148605 [Dreissena polymorpha]
MRFFQKIRKNFFTAVQGIVDKVTPRKKHLMKQKQLLNTPMSMKKLFYLESSSKILTETMKSNRQIKKNIVKRMLFLKKHWLNRTLSTFLGVSNSYVSKTSGIHSEQPKQCERKAATIAEDRTAIKEFFLRVDISTNLPSVKTIKKDQKERRILDRPLAAVYQEFQQQNPTVKASYSTFVRNKPQTVESTRKQRWYACLCDTCTNTDLKIKALQQVASRIESGVVVRNRYEAVTITLCKNKDGAAFHKPQCIQRQCGKCGIDSTVRYFQPLVEEASNETVVYSKWERVKKIYKGK